MGTNIIAAWPGDRQRKRTATNRFTICILGKAQWRNVSHKCGHNKFVTIALTHAKPFMGTQTNLWREVCWRMGNVVDYLLWCGVPNCKQCATSNQNASANKAMDIFIPCNLILTRIRPFKVRSYRHIFVDSTFLNVWSWSEICKLVNVWQLIVYDTNRFSANLYQYL